MAIKRTKLATITPETEDELGIEALIAEIDGGNDLPAFVVETCDEGYEVYREA